MRAPGDGVGTVPVGVSVLPDHVRVDLDSDASGAWRDCADALYGIGEPAMAVRVLADHPGCLLACVRDRADGRCTAVTRDGVRIEAGRVRDEREHARVVSALYRLYALNGTNGRNGLNGLHEGTG
ncbi:hypothetical protein OG292_03430 [Streptomyces sp. NBC_01511]|uniref:hypothetical protein n=1 Tax=Streptomyces sp. NBC_01511 TaxID=2903889 RepID=UPI00386ED7A9